MTQSTSHFRWCNFLAKAPVGVEMPKDVARGLVSQLHPSDLGKGVLL